MNPTELANKIILAVEAHTSVNSRSKKSRFQLMEFRTGQITYQRNDGIFFENFQFDGAEWLIFYRFETNNFELTSPNKKTIFVTQYEPK